MLQLKNATPFAASLIVLPDAAGIDTIYAVVKATFVIEPALQLADEQTTVAFADKYYEDPQATSIEVPSDVCLGKPGTDVLLIGSAWAPHGAPTWQSDVSLRVGSIAKSVRVYGDRVWETTVSGTSISWVAPFVSMPLRWERAYGGADETDKGRVSEPRNPVGRGFRARNSAKAVTGVPLPNIEDPEAPITSWRDTPAPVGFAAVAPHWEPRCTFAGTYDEAWQSGRAPYLPNDFDARFFQIAPAGLWLSEGLHGGELVDIRGATPDGRLQFALPMLQIDVRYRFDNDSHSRRGMLDTVIVKSDERRLIMVWRAALPCDKKTLKAREVNVRATQPA